MNQRILVTGGTGLLGSYLLRWFKKQGYSNLTGTFQNPKAVIPEDLQQGVVWKRLRLPDIPDAFDVIANQDWVIHSAGLVSYFKEDKYKLLEVNQQGTEHIVNACIAHDIQHLVYIGSISALGKEANHVTLTESNPWLQNKFSTSYALSKYLGEVEAWRGAAEGLNVSVILPSIILGSGDWHRSSLQLVDRVVNATPLYPGGRTGYVDVRDVAAFCGNLLENNLSGDRWILSAQNMTYKEIYEQLGNALSLKRTFREAPRLLAKYVLLATNLKSGRLSFPEFVDQVYASFYYDNSKSKTLSGFQYRPMEETLRDVAKAYLKKESNTIMAF